MHRYRKIMLPAVLVAAFLPTPAAADGGKELFEKHCAGCHTIGGGDSGGPDLKGITATRPAEWLVRVTVEPDKLTAEKDLVHLALVKKYGFEMPNLGISREDARSIIAYLSGGKPAAAASTGPANKGAAPSAAETTTGATSPGEAAPKPAETVATPELVARGKALFTGARAFSRGGAPCSSCHDFSYPGVAAGNLAADLSNHFEGMGEQGFRGVLKGLKFPTMKKIYADKSLTDEEITALVAFARDAAERATPAAGSSFPAAGAGFFACFIIGLAIHKRRIR